MNDNDAASPGPSHGAPSLPGWLPLLERMHRVVDAGVVKAVRARQRSTGVKLACRRGCSACCKVNDLPAFQVELAGMSRFAVELLGGPGREGLKAQLAAHRPGDPCPFLVADACVVHPVRPIACRLFNLFGTPCAPGEDPYRTRPRDLLEPPGGLLGRAYREMLPFHGVTDRADQDRWLAQGLVRTLGVSLRSCDWRSLARMMERAEGGGPTSG